MPLRRGVDHLAAVRGIAVLIEVEAGAAGFVGETHDAMAGVGIDPCARGLGCLRESAGEGEKSSGRGQAHANHYPAMSVFLLAGIAGWGRRVIFRLRRAEQFGEDRLQAIRPDLVTLQGGMQLVAGVHHALE